MDVVTLKIILVVVMTLVTICFGLLPMKVLKLLRKRANRLSSESTSKWPSLLLCLLSCFTGGVFLSTCFLHLLPETNAHLAVLKDALHWHVDYPLAELISCAGFFLVFFVEELVILCMSDKHHNHAHTCMPNNIEANRDVLGRAHASTSDHNHDDMQKTPDRADVIGVNNGGSHTVCTETPHDRDVVRQRLLLANYGKTDDSSPQSDSSAGPETKASSCSAGGSCKKRCVTPFSDTDCDSTRNGAGLRVTVRQRSSTVACICGQVESVHLCANRQCWQGYGSCHNIVCDRNDTDETCVNLELAEPERCEGPCDGIEEDPPILMSSRPHLHSHEVRSVTLIIALSFHSVIEGLAFGVQSTTGAVVTLFLSLILHKMVIAFSIGLQLSRTHAHQLHFVFVGIIVLALMSPLGATIGIAVEVSNMGQSVQDILVMVFEGLSVGTFLYVTFFEILIHERDNEHPNLLKLLFTLIGFGAIAAIRYKGRIRHRLLEHDHPEASHHHDDVEHDHDIITTTMTALANATA